MTKVPVIDVASLLDPLASEDAMARTAGEIALALGELGFFYVRGHGVPAALSEEILDEARRFFAEPLERKMDIAMPKAGLAWRGYFPPGGELTSGRPDRKEGIYFGTEDAGDERPLHGANQWPAGFPRLRDNVLTYMESLTALGHALMEGIALSLGLDRGYFRARFRADPTILFRIFSYAPHAWTEAQDEWGVREHTDYGFLTILRQDDSGGLQVKALDGRWISAPPLPDTFVVNIGDMLEYWTHGRYRATPHRVRNEANKDRLSLPFFFDPAWDATLERIPLADGTARAEAAERWDRLKLHDLPPGYTYGEFLWNKVKKVFPDLK